MYLNHSMTFNVILLSCLAVCHVSLIFNEDGINMCITTLEWHVMTLVYLSVKFQLDWSIPSPLIKLKVPSSCIFPVIFFECLSQWDSTAKWSISFNKFKRNIFLEPHLAKTINNKHKIAISRFRMSNHSLMIEKGRHMKPKMDMFINIRP